MERDEVKPVTWDAWNRVLTGVAGIVALGGRKDSEALARIYDVAMELRERLRYSLGRLRSLKQELSATIAAARSERNESMVRLQELEGEVARLAGAVQAQGSTLVARETLANSQTSENEQLRRHIAGLERQLQRCEEDRRVAMGEREDALRHLDRMSHRLEASEGRVVEVQEEQNALLGELVATKDRLADVSALEALYGAARDELLRLDKENLELKDIVSSGAVQLGRSRILEALGLPDSAMEAAALDAEAEAAATLGKRQSRARGKTLRRRRRSGSGHQPSSPLLLGFVGGGVGGVGTAGSEGLLGRSRSAPRTRWGSPLLTGSSVSGSPHSPRGPLQLSSQSQPHSLYSYAPSAPHSQSQSHSHVHSMSLEDPVSEMAFLGPPSSAYPPDPDNYILYRVGGGYKARVNPVKPTISQPRASGWVPKDVVRLVQAFRHSYGLCLEWRFWEPLVLMVDEVYRSRANGVLAAMRTMQREKLKMIKRQVRAALGFPSVVANGKINHLQRQLSSARKVLALSDRKGEQSLRQMAVKDYHLGYQLDRAVEENYSLRRSLEDLEHVYNRALNVDGGATTGDRQRRSSTTSPGMVAPAPASPPPPRASEAPSPLLGLRRSVTSDLYATALASPQHPSSVAPQPQPSSTPNVSLSRSGSYRQGGGRAGGVSDGDSGFGGGSGHLSPRPSGHLSPRPSGHLSPRPSGHLSPRPSGYLSPRPSLAPSPHPQAAPPHSSQRLSQSQLKEQQLQQQQLQLQMYQLQQLQQLQQHLQQRQQAARDAETMSVSRHSTAQQHQVQKQYSDHPPASRSTSQSQSHRQTPQPHMQSYAHSLSHTHSLSQSQHQTPGPSRSPSRSHSQINEPLQNSRGSSSRCNSMVSMVHGGHDSAVDRASLRSLP